MLCITSLRVGISVSAFWKKFWIIPVAFSCAFGIALVDRGAGLRTYWQLRTEVRDAQMRIAALEQENEALRREAKLLETDSFTIEQAIREDLGLARPGEVVVKLPGEEKFPFLDASSVEAESSEPNARTTTP